MNLELQISGRDQDAFFETARHTIYNAGAKRSLNANTEAGREKVVWQATFYVFTQNLRQQERRQFC